MISSPRLQRYNFLASICVIAMGFLRVGYHCLAFQQPITYHVRDARGSIHFCDDKKTSFSSSPITHKTRGTRSDAIKFALTEENIMEIAASSWMHDSGMLLSFEGPSFGELATGIVGLGLVASVGAFVFANVVYTPEILEGAKDLRRSEREVEIRKLLEAIQNHEIDGKDVMELRFPLETALGKPLEDYVRDVLEPVSDENDTLFTAADTELATLLKQTI